MDTAAPGGLTSLKLKPGIGGLSESTGNRSPVSLSFRQGVVMPLMIRNSSRTLYKRCQRAYWWAYVDGLAPRRQTDALAFGTWVHDALAQWYCGPGLKRGPHPAETFLAMADDSLRQIKVDSPDEESEARYLDLRSLGQVLMEEYVKHWGRDDHISVIQPERTIDFRVPYPRQRGDKTRYARQVGTVDLIYRDLTTEFVWLKEHKTAKTISTKHLTLDEQPSTYLSIAERSLKRQGLLLPNERIHGVMYNFLRKGLPDPRPVDEEGYSLNRDGSRSKSQPRPLFVREPVHRTRASRRVYLNRLAEDALKIRNTMRQVARHGEGVLSKTPHVNCSRFCAFFQMCELEDQGGNWQSYRDAMFVKTDMFAAHKSTDTTPTFDFG